MGFLPDIGLHHRGGLYFQESSYAFRVEAILTLMVAVACCFVPLEIHTFLGQGPKLKYFIAAGLGWTGLCIWGGSVLRNSRGGMVIIDPQDKTVSIQHSDYQPTTSWSQIVGIQLCGGRTAAYQANLVYQTVSGEIERYCLISNAMKKHTSALARQYHTRFGFPLIDHCER